MKMIKIAAAASLVAAGMTASVSTPAQAQDLMGTVKYVGMNWCPRTTVEAAGQLLPISSYTAMFSLYGTIYGGDGRTTFAMPDLRGRAPIVYGQGPGLSYHAIGGRGGIEQTTLSQLNLPSHTHVATLRAADRAPTSDNPAGKILGDFEDGRLIYADPPANVNMASDAITVGAAGGSQSFSNMQPYTVINACVVIQGIYPSRS